MDEYETDEGIKTCLDFVLSVELVVVQSVLGNPCACLVHILHERDVPFCGNEPDFVQIWVSGECQSADITAEWELSQLGEECHKLVLGDTFW